MAESRFHQLENELAQNRDDMRSITVDMEAANEELQSANEELLSSSEEMQSLNEELETSKEELQSTNEELLIVNQELLDKQEEINAARFYAEAIVTTMREPLVILNRSLRIKTANASFYSKFNVDEKETENKLFYEIQNHQFNDRTLLSLLEEILPKKKRINDFELKLRFPSIGERIILLNARQILKEKTAEQLILLAIEDVTEKRQVEQRLQTFSDDLEIEVGQRTADLRHMNTQLEQFAYLTSHDLQEPLRKIVTFSTVIQQGHKEELSDELKTYLSKIEVAATRMRKLMQDLLQYSSLDKEGNSFPDTDLNEVLEDILNDYELYIKDKKAVIKTGPMPVIAAIPLQMTQLFSNLIGNALKFSAQTGVPRISITSRLLTGNEMKKFPALTGHADRKYERQYVELIFKDNGIGFDQKYADRIFIIFHRLHPQKLIQKKNVKDTMIAYEGTGIGLTLCKRIVDNHHGLIFCKAKEGKGAVFQVILPISRLE